MTVLPFGGPGSAPKLYEFATSDGCPFGSQPIAFTATVWMPLCRLSGMSERFTGIVATRIPEVGRSGGPLEQNGRLVGVTTNQAPTWDSGVYCHPRRIAEFLDRTPDYGRMK